MFGLVEHVPVTCIFIGAGAARPNTGTSRECDPYAYLPIDNDEFTTLSAIYVWYLQVEKRKANLLRGSDLDKKD